MERKEILSIEEVIKAIEAVVMNRRKATVMIKGDLIKANSQRLQTFYKYGLKCACCGVEGKYFAKEKNINDVSYHLNLYAIDNDGKEVLMTKDHIIPSSKGGKNYVSNYQPMCEKCNSLKGNN